MCYDHPVSVAKVCIRQEDGEWHVTVITASGERSENSFTIREYAENYAQGQRIRVGLSKVEEGMENDKQ